MRVRTWPIASELEKLSAQVSRPIVPSSVSATPSRSPIEYRPRAMSSSLILRWWRRMWPSGAMRTAALRVGRPPARRGRQRRRPGVAGRLGEALAMGAGDGAGQAAGPGIGPTEVQALGQDYQAAALGDGLADRGWPGPGQPAPWPGQLWRERPPSPTAPWAGPCPVPEVTLVAPGHPPRRRDPSRVRPRPRADEASPRIDLQDRAGRCLRTNPADPRPPASASPRPPEAPRCLTSEDASRSMVPRFASQGSHRFNPRPPGRL